jgi:ribosomal protein S18 acetylase RimI-like enzyme
MERTIVLKDGRSVVLRPLQETDLERSLAFFNRLDPAERRYLRRDVTKRAVVAERILEAASPLVERVVAVHDDAIVADGSFEHERYGWGVKSAQIRLIVAPEFRRVGLGLCLARQLFVIANQHDIARINVRMLRPQKAAREIFHRLGFREEFLIPDHVQDLQGQMQDLVVMRCNLSILCEGVAREEAHGD